MALSNSRTKGGLVKTSFALKPELIEHLDALAEERDTSRSKVVALLCKVGFEELERLRRVNALAA